MQERVTFPSMITLQAPQCPAPQPILHPVSSSRSRRISARDSVPSTTIVLSTPLMIRTFFTILQPPILFTSFFVFCGALRRDNFMRQDCGSTQRGAIRVSCPFVGQILLY